jgi:hypothetical protein
MRTLAEIDALARIDALSVFGAFHPTAEDAAPDRIGTLILFGPHEPGFWDHVTGEPEFSDDAPDPIDRWSERVISDLATRLQGLALFPFGGPPYQPFQRWAVASGRAWVSPVGLLVHDHAGLMVSYRGGIALEDRIALPPAGTRPCDTCTTQPCLAACPVGAISSQGYELGICHTYLDSKAGRSCLTGGCAVRVACPAGRAYARRPEQSAYHMRQFHPWD